MRDVLFIDLTKYFPQIVEFRSYLQITLDFWGDRIKT